MDCSFLLSSEYIVTINSVVEYVLIAVTYTKYSYRLSDKPRF